MSLGLWKVAGVAVVGLLVLGFFVFVYGQIRDGGARATVDTINELNKGAGDAGENARLNRRDCIARGMRWRTETGQCVGGP